MRLRIGIHLCRRCQPCGRRQDPIATSQEGILRGFLQWNSGRFR
jgi:hypothetical protein